MTDAQVIEVRRLVDGLRRDRRRDPYRGTPGVHGASRQGGIRLADFKDALRERCLAELARLGEVRCANNDPDPWAIIVAVRDLREQLAAVSGDVDAHVAVHCQTSPS